MAEQKIIVLPTDFSIVSLAALEWGVRMSAVLGAQLHAIFVLEEPHIYGTLEMGPLPVPSGEELQQSAEARMAKFVEHQLAGGSAVGKVVVGRPSEEIVRYAEDFGAELIVMALHGYTGVRHMIMGSTTEAVLRHAKCPVLSVRSE
jgi:universal stress protein A